MKFGQNITAGQTYLGVFGKYWQAGQVKTRLAKAIGDQQASLVYLSFLRTTLQRFSKVADQRVLAYWPCDRFQEFAELAGESWNLTPQIPPNSQPEQDLGQRMIHFFDVGFQQGAKRVVLVGSDSPTLPVSYIEQAFTALGEQHAVVGPAADGGYYLIGMSRFEPRIFQAIPWSTGQVFFCTVERIQQLDLTFHTLPKWNDVDDLADLLRLRSQLEDSRSPDENCEKLRAELDGLLSELPR